MKSGQRHGRRRWSSALAAAVGAFLFASGVATSTGDQAFAIDYTVVPDTTDDGMLVLSSAKEKFDVTLGPGDSKEWLIRAHLEGPTRSTLALQVSGEGRLVSDPDGLMVSIETCDLEWVTIDDSVTGACPGTWRHLVSLTRLATAAAHSSIAQWKLDGLTAAQARYLRLSIALPEGTAIPGPGDTPRRGSIGVGLYASGDEGGPGDHPGPLPLTGSAPVGWLVAVAGMLLACGGLMSAHARRQP